jgi:hypothetical protein
MIKLRGMRWRGQASFMGEKRNTCRILVGKPRGKKQLERTRCRWEDIKMGLREMRCGVID